MRRVRTALHPRRQPLRVGDDVNKMERYARLYSGVAIVINGIDVFIRDEYLNAAIAIGEKRTAFTHEAATAPWLSQLKRRRTLLRQTPS